MRTLFQFYNGIYKENLTIVKMIKPTISSFETPPHKNFERSRLTFVRLIGKVKYTRRNLYSFLTPKLCCVTIDWSLTEELLTKV